MSEDFKKIIREIILYKNFVVFCSTFYSALSLIYLLFFYQPDYISVSKIYLSDKKSNQLSLGGLSQLGIQIPFSSGGAATSQISVIAEIAGSQSFLEKLLNEKVMIDESTHLILFDWLNLNSENDIKDYESVVITSLKLKKMIKVIENYQSSIVKIEVTSKNRFVSQSINRIVIDSANNFLIVQDNIKAEDKLLFINSRIKEVEENLKIAENLLKDFRYKNINVTSSPDLQMKLEHLKRDVKFETAILTTLLEQKEVAKIQKNEKSENFNILSDPNLPVFPSSQRRLFQLVFYVVSSIALSISIIVAKIFYLNLFRSTRKFLNQL